MENNKTLAQIQSEANRLIFDEEITDLDFDHILPALRDVPPGFTPERFAACIMQSVVNSNFPSMEGS
jgi:hypothetical protein